MNILTISLNAWNDTQATGNTFSNFFENRDENLNFANIYCRNEPYQNNLCSRYYKITESDIITSFNKKSQLCGNVVLSNNVCIQKYSKSSRITLLKDFILHKCRPALLLFIREFIWMTNKWKTSELDSFLKDVSPDIIYMHGHNNRYMHNLLWYCKQATNAKVVVFFGDDMYGFKSYRPGQILYHMWFRSKLEYTIKNADLLLGGTQNLCDEYSKIYKRVFYPQYKTCNKILPPNTIGDKNRISIVYAGNLLYGRKELLINFVNILKELNKREKVKIILHIYTSSVLSKKNLQLLNDGYNSIYYGPKNYHEICDILNQCDATLFLESFKANNIRQTRLSFSTKIIDSMQSSSSLIVYGPNNIASIQYLIKTETALVASNEDDMYNILSQIQVSPQILNTYAQKKYNYALKYHTSSTLIPRMKDLMLK